MTTLRELEPGLWLTELSLEQFDVRGAVILGSRGALVWDTLSHPRDMAPVAELVAGRPVTIVYSHADWDHIWGMAGLAAAPIVGQAACLERFQEDVPVTLEQRLAEQPELWNGVRLIPPDSTFARERILDIGGLSLVLHHLPGHTRDCCVGYVPEWGVLLMGDTVETPFPVVNDATALSGWISGLERWADEPAVRVVVPAHGAVGGREVIAGTLAYLRGLLAGREPTVPNDLSDFYRDTHAANRRAAAGARPPGRPN